MRTARVVAALVGFLATISCGASIVYSSTLTRGTVEVSPWLAFSHNYFWFEDRTTERTSTLATGGMLGYCISDHLEIGGGLLMNYVHNGSLSSDIRPERSVGFTGDVQYNFADIGPTVPFIRGAIGMLPNRGDPPDGRTSLFAPILQVGLRQLLGSSGSVNVGFGYQRQSNVLGSADISANSFSFEMGVSIFARRRK